mmetsp:Transcript_20448/g.66028  ORF Transcript_20448/g.66028 Transcript_20448/m.66028 type:complete len:543 (+) Transcript_20448:1816-3444(+)
MACAGGRSGSLVRLKFVEACIGDVAPQTRSVPSVDPPRPPTHPAPPVVDAVAAQVGSLDATLRANVVLDVEPLDERLTAEKLAEPGRGSAPEQLMQKELLLLMLLSKDAESNLREQGRQPLDEGIPVCTQMGEHRRVWPREKELPRARQPQPQLQPQPQHHQEEQEVQEQALQMLFLQEQQRLQEQEHMRQLNQHRPQPLLEKLLQEQSQTTPLWQREQPAPPMWTSATGASASHREMAPGSMASGISLGSPGGLVCRDVAAQGAGVPPWCPGSFRIECVDPQQPRQHDFGKIGGIAGLSCGGSSSSSTRTHVVLELFGDGVKDLPVAQRRIGPIAVSALPVLVGRRHQPTLHAEAVRDECTSLIEREHFCIASVDGVFYLMALSSSGVWRVRDGEQPVFLGRDGLTSVRSGDRVALFCGVGGGSESEEDMRAAAQASRTLCWRFRYAAGEAAVDLPPKSVVSVPARPADRCCSTEGRSRPPQGAIASMPAEPAASGGSTEEEPWWLAPSCHTPSDRCSSRPLAFSEEATDVLVVGGEMVTM